MVSNVCSKEQEELFDALDHLNKLAIQANLKPDEHIETLLESGRARYKEARAALARCEEKNNKEAAR